jgi:hypothetical protein
MKANLLMAILAACGVGRPRFYSTTAGRNKYLPHQGKAERARRRKESQSQAKGLK